MRWPWSTFRGPRHEFELALTLFAMFVAYGLGCAMGLLLW